MNNLKYILLALSTTALVACDEIAENERYVEVDPIEAKRNVLIEDFTGQACPNCPEAHEVADALMSQYPDNVITVCIHAGTFAWTEGTKSYPTFKTAEGDTYAREAGVTEYPSGIINRRGGTQSYSEWATIVGEEMAEETDCMMTLAPVFNADSTEISIETTVTTSSDVAGKLQLWVTESGIVSRQKHGASWITNYVHNHIYRASVNGMGGEDVTLQPFETVTSQHTQAVREDWNGKNLAIVAFVYNSDGVLQVVEKKVK